MKLFSEDIARITGGKLSGPPDLAAVGISTDSRQMNVAGGVVFFAIKGRNHDGHQFIETLYNRGVRIFVTEKNHHPSLKQHDAAFILTDNTIRALQLLAAWKRHEYKSDVIAITGSAGKTIVKEWLAEVIGRSVPVVRSPRSYNSQIGVPLSVWNLDNKYRFGIFEAGISFPGEMDNLRMVIDPDIGVMTNIGDAHGENFKDIREKASEKLKLFTNARKIIYCRDHKIIHDLMTGDPKLGGKELFDWSFEDRNARIFIIRRQLPDGKTVIEAVFQGNKHEFTIPFTDRASVENAITVASVCLSVNIDPGIISAGLLGLVSVAMRMELKNGVNNCRLIEDYYNSDPGSLSMAIEYLLTQTGRKPVLILSDFVQSGRDAADLYGGVASLVRRSGIEKFIGIGPAISSCRELFGPGSSFYGSTEEYLRCLNLADYRDEIILIKGARMFEFERIGKMLERQIHQTVLEVNLDAISHNLNEFRRHLSPETRMMVMVKAFAYGAGPAEIASLMEFHRVSYLAVACADEGIELRQGGVTMPVMVMNPDPSGADLMIKYNLEPEIFSFASLRSFDEAASRHGLISYPVHIKIDTGMHRLGFMPEDIDMLAREISNWERLRVVSVFSHLAGSEDPSLDTFSEKQVGVFLEAAAKIREATGYDFLRHILNSSGIARMPEYQFEMVRPGIGIYGVGNLGGLSLRTAGRFRTRISQVKRIKAGEPVGYGCADVSESDRDVAILPVGYADGLMRKLGNRNGELFICGRRVRIIGNICMDMCMADVTGTGAEAGDEAEIFGENINIGELALKCGTIPYEILTSIPVRVKRVFFRE